MNTERFALVASSTHVCQRDDRPLCCERPKCGISEAEVPTTAVTVPVERGFINLGNGNLHIEIPFTSYKGRGALSTNLRMVYDSMIWHGAQLRIEVNGSRTTSPIQWAAGDLYPLPGGISDGEIHCK